MKNLLNHVAAVLILLTVLVMITWVAGVNFDGTCSDPFDYDHPENFTRAQ